MVKRYYISKQDSDAHEHPQGYFVAHDDYAALQTVANHYKGEMAALEAENKRLREIAEKALEGAERGIWPLQNSAQHASLIRSLLGKEPT